MLFWKYKLATAAKLWVKSQQRHLTIECTKWVAWDSNPGQAG